MGYKVDNSNPFQFKIGCKRLCFNYFKGGFTQSGRAVVTYHGFLRQVFLPLCYFKTKIYSAIVINQSFSLHLR